MTYRAKRGLGNGHLMTIAAWGRRRQFPRLPPPVERLFDVAPDTRVLAHCHWQPDRHSAPGAPGPPRPGRLEPGALHARTCGQGVRRRLQRRAAQPAELRRNGTALGRALSLRADPRCRPRHWRTGRGRRPPADHRRRLFARRQPRAEARGRLWRRSPASAPRCLRRLTGDGARGLRSRSRAAAELRLPVEFRTWTEGADAPQERLLPGTVRHRSSRRNQNRA